MKDLREIRLKLTESLQVIGIYEWLLNSYVLDFYVENHWSKMPNAWIEMFSAFKPEDIADCLIPCEKQNQKIVWPLSFIALRTLLRKLCISRETQSIHTELMMKMDLPANSYYLHSQLKTVLTKKNIKEKKRHEIERMSKLTATIARQCKVKYVIDFGAGLGHLARSLSYGHGLKVCCLEQQSALSAQAMELDQHVENLAAKFLRGNATCENPVHLNVCLRKDTDLKELVQEIRKRFKINPDEKFNFGIIGLHPCGNLASILTNFFLNAPEAKFLNLVGCCYMKLTCQQRNTLYEHELRDEDFIGYPLSDYLRSKHTQSHLSYESREIACHAIEQYTQRLASQNYDHLRVHSFRATIERIICKYWPEYKHSGLKSIKRLTSFTDYCQQAVSHLGIQIPQSDIEAAETKHNLSDWTKVVIFYSLRLMLAPLVESVILYDRLLWLKERNCNATIRAIFNPDISPRNHIITAIK